MPCVEDKKETAQWEADKDIGYRAIQAALWLHVLKVEEDKFNETVQAQETRR